MARVPGQKQRRHGTISKVRPMCRAPGVRALCALRARSALRGDTAALVNARSNRDAQRRSRRRPVKTSQSDMPLTRTSGMRDVMSRIRTNFAWPSCNSI